MQAADDEPGQRHVVVLTHECWQRRFGGDPQIVGRSLILNGEGYEVIGIAPRDFSLPNPQAELAIPLAPDVDPLRNERGSVNFLRLIGRLKSDVTINQAEADLAGIVQRQRQQFGDAYLKKTGVNLVSLHEEIVGATRTKLWVLFGAVSLVLLIGCCNLAALSLTRASARSQEIAMSAVIFGILPAWQGARVEADGALRSSSRGAGDVAQLNRWRSILVVGEVAISR